MLLSFLELQFDLIFAFAVIWSKFKAIAVGYSFLLCFCFRTYAILNVQLFHFLLEFASILYLEKLKYFDHLLIKCLDLVFISFLLALFWISIRNICNLFNKVTKLFKRHFFVALWVLFEYFYEVASVEDFTDFCNLKIFAENHELIDRHNGSFMFYLFKSRVLPSGITYFAVVLKYYFKKVFVFFAELSYVELVWTWRCDFVSLFKKLLLLYLFSF